LESHTDIDRKEFTPFSVGPTSCIGRNVAYLAYNLALAHLLYAYDGRMSAGKLTDGGAANLEIGRRREGEYQMKDWFAGYPEGPIVEFRARYNKNLHR
jgi:hypothetical protein